MFDRLQKPFLTVETGEAYQPIRLTYQFKDKDKLLQSLENLKCIEKNVTPNSWNWFWKAECDDIHFESLESFRRFPQQPVRLGTFTIKDNKLFLQLPSFKRACLAVIFFHKVWDITNITVRHADFLNKVFALDERLPHGFTELFKDEELEQFIHRRVEDYNKVKEQCEHATSVEEAFTLLANYSTEESKKRLPYAERYFFEEKHDQDPEVLYLAFYIFLRGRELVAIKRWYGEAGYSLADAAEDTFDTVFGELRMDVV